ncbi:armadillo-type protein [Clohesyomyces aquaticus]|uniref:AP-3 complex subunit delta n=1 Tax=Clohesyomyces aquaticus TaxID=1231657 RepID=A0A1Y2A159_9PLEO|nr:armadillo-type protein [Clohesyomyces aquaticus]
MFEKSLYDLIRGLRNHKGSEKEYIASSIKECRSEIRTNDMDLKSTALMKLTYLEMFGHDMSWASFNVLEVMSSPKYRHKRTGYLAAVQSFRRDTEVLMLAENQLKKDITSPTPTVISLPLGAIPHVVNPSMANGLLGDLLPRLTHSHAAIRKKTVVTLYRLALVYPETLRPAWPKIKERLLDDSEDPTVTAAIVNVVCELGWRRPQDFLPLAPRLFDLLVEGGNNWMAIKLIKLFATLTPLEPRLIKKLLPPLTRIIRETSAMSLLYECINGIIQGGILAAVEDTAEGEEVARLCVGKLRGMMIEGDANLKYVALLAFDKIVRSHPHLVSQQQDVILECIDDADISIRMCALDLVVGMVNVDNLTAIVGRLMRQLRNAPIVSSADDPANDRGRNTGVIPYAESDDSDAEESLRPAEQNSNEIPPLPEDYRVNVIRRILEMCSRDTYANISDFEWYIDVLVQLVRVSPATKPLSAAAADPEDDIHSADVGRGIGRELQNVAIRVRSARSEAVEAAQSLVIVDFRDKMFPSSGNGGQSVLKYAGWLVGEFAAYLSRPDPILTSLMHTSSVQLPPRILAVYIQAIPKVFSRLSGNDQISWTPERKTLMSLLMARIIHFLDPLSTHPDLEVQERAVEFLELMRLAAEAASGTSTSHPDGSNAEGDFIEPPLLLTQALPALFSGAELNPVAPGAQRKVPLPRDIDLEEPINRNLASLLAHAETAGFESDDDDIWTAYNEPPASTSTAATSLSYHDTPSAMTAAERLDAAANPKPSSYQNADAEDYLDADILLRRKLERRERYKDDPFYIDSEKERGSRGATPLGRIVRDQTEAAGEELDIDKIPIMDLSKELGMGSRATRGEEGNGSGRRSPRKKKAVEIIADETVGPAEDSHADFLLLPNNKSGTGLPKSALLALDSSALGSLSLEDDSETPNSNSGSRARISALQRERKEKEDAEMRKAMQEVERLRLEMQRASERLEARGETVVRKKKKKKVRRVVDVEDDGQGVEGEIQGEKVDGGEEGEKEGVKKKKKKVKKKVEDGEGGGEGVGDGMGAEGEVVKKKKKKRRQVDLDAEA